MQLQVFAALCLKACRFVSRITRLLAHMFDKSTWEA